MPRKSSLIINLLSVVIPAYQQEKTIRRNLKQIETTLKTLGYPYEIIVVVDGMTDQTYKKARQYRSSHVTIIGCETNQGKGCAVRYGMMQAKGDIIGFIDAGMDIHPAGFNMLLNHMEWYNADVIVGSKLHPASKVTYPYYRKILSWGYRFLTATLFGFKVRDTQVGLKFFKKKVIRNVLPRLLVKRYAFDIEILAVAYRLGYKRIFEAPIEITFNNNSIISKSVIKTITYMLWDTLAVFYRLHIRRYYTSEIANRRPSIFSRNTKVIVEK